MDRPAEGESVAQLLAAEVIGGIRDRRKRRGLVDRAVVTVHRHAVPVDHRAVRGADEGDDDLLVLHQRHRRHDVRPVVVEDAERAGVGFLQIEADRAVIRAEEHRAALREVRGERHLEREGARGDDRRHRVPQTEQAPVPRLQAFGVVGAGVGRPPQARRHRNGVVAVAGEVGPPRRRAAVLADARVVHAVVPHLQPVLHVVRAFRRGERACADRTEDGRDGKRPLRGDADRRVGRGTVQENAALLDVPRDEFVPRIRFGREVRREGAVLVDGCGDRGRRRACTDAHLAAGRRDTLDGDRQIPGRVEGVAAGEGEVAGRGAPVADRVDGVVHGDLGVGQRMVVDAAGMVGAVEVEALPAFIARLFRADVRGFAAEEGRDGLCRLRRRQHPVLPGRLAAGGGGDRETRRFVLDEDGGAVEIDLGVVEEAAQLAVGTAFQVD